MSQKIIIAIAFCFLMLTHHSSTGQSSKAKTAGMVKVGIACAPVSSCGEKGNWTIHDDLYGGALWIDDGKNPVVMITLDHMEMTGVQTVAVKKEITRAVGLPADHILISCSHTHSGMELDNIKLGVVLSEIIRQAQQKAEPALIAFGDCNAGKHLSVNRRMKVNDKLGAFTISYSRGTKVSVEEGTVDVRGQVEDFISYGVNIYSPNYSTRGIKPGKSPSALAPEVLREIPQKLNLNGPVDPHLEVLAFRRPDGTAIGTLVRFACHPVIFSGSSTKQFSADYPGVLKREISKVTGAPTLFINGSCGDIKPVFTNYGEAETERIGRALAQIVTNSLPGLKAEPLASFSYIHREEDFEVAPDMLRKPVGSAEYDSLSNVNFDPVVLKKKLDQAMRSWAVGYYKLKEGKMRLPFSLLGFNRIALITLPGEIFTEHGLAIKNSYPGKQLMIGELTDTDEDGYVPTREAFADGGYEVSCATIVPGSGEKMVQIASGMLKDFYKAK
jgi:neutral ceramidase